MLKDNSTVCIWKFELSQPSLYYWNSRINIWVELRMKNTITSELCALTLTFRVFFLLQTSYTAIAKIVLSDKIYSVGIPHEGVLLMPQPLRCRSPTRWAVDGAWGGRGPDASISAGMSSDLAGDRGYWEPSPCARLNGQCDSSVGFAGKHSKRDQPSPGLIQ